MDKNENCVRQGATKQLPLEFMCVKIFLDNCVLSDVKKIEKRMEKSV